MDVEENVVSIFCKNSYTLGLLKSGVLEIRKYLKSGLFLAVQNKRKLFIARAETGVEPKIRLSTPQSNQNSHSSTKL